MLALFMTHDTIKMYSDAGKSDGEIPKMNPLFLLLSLCVFYLLPDIRRVEKRDVLWRKRTI